MKITVNGEAIEVKEKLGLKSFEFQIDKARYLVTQGEGYININLTSGSTLIIPRQTGNFDIWPIILQTPLDSWAAAKEENEKIKGIV